MTKTMFQEGQGAMALLGGETFYALDRVATWRPPTMAELPSWRGAKRIGYDCETCDPDLLALGPGVRRPGSYVCGFSFAIEDGPKHYLPIRHEGGDNLPEENVLAYLNDQFKDFDGDLVGANLPYDLDWSWENGIAMPKVRRFYDVQVSDPLIYELYEGKDGGYKLDSIAKRWNCKGKNEDALRAAAAERRCDPKVDLWRLPARHVGVYAEDDAEQPLEILRKQERKMEEDGLESVWDMESRLLPVLVRMTRKGVVVDMDRVEQVEAWSRKREQEQWDIVHHHTGVRIPVGECMNVKLLTAALRQQNLDDYIGQTAKGVDSVTKDRLHLVKDHPVVAAILDARKVSIIRTTFVAGTRRHVVERNGEYRMHCSFNQIRKTEEGAKEGVEEDTKGVAYGRLSASHVNMQNQPAADRRTGDNRIGCMWRSVYKTDQGTMWTACDLKQQEPKWSYHYGALMEKSGVEGVTGALEMCRRLQENPMLDSYEPLVDMTGQPRPVCKIMWLSRAYGKGDGNLCKELGLPTRQVCYSRELWKTVPVDSPEGQRALASGGFEWEGAGEEGQKIIDAFDGSMPFLKVSAKIAKKRADKQGYVTLLSGRRCHFEKEGGKYQWTHKAFNRLIQGAGAEQTKQIMLAVNDAGFGDYLILQVHDELDAAFETEKQGDDMAEVMRHAVPMLVPTTVDIERGPTWGESMNVEYVSDGKKIKHKYNFTTE